ncbi:hypothetical protein L211DRAFT_895538 [Terfezia boudieri ATCC MYA-4762]|uniref:Uncharacterized protein n=1 Tax=Terfezia boudieri ATCC MYA-4762 TaxID=1051890 RepID=A0A3N4LAP6_9PEZI|nr:hypothetical protein L211DRAFT_895538 [Terfezia boudieri ATCC MYA-4762]
MAPKNATNLRDSYTGCARPFRYIAPAPRTTLPLSSLEGESPQGTRAILRPNMRTSTYNHTHDTPVSITTQLFGPYPQPPEPNIIQHKNDSSHLPVHDCRKPPEAGGVGKRQHGISQCTHSEDGFRSNAKRARGVRNRAGGDPQNSEIRGTRLPSSIGSTSGLAAVLPPVEIDPPTPGDCTYIMASLDGGESDITCENRTYPVDIGSLYESLNSVPFINSPLPFYPTSPATTPGVQLQYGYTLEHPSISNHAPSPRIVLPTPGAKQGPHLNSISPASGILHEMSLNSKKATAEAQMLQEDVSPKNVCLVQLPETQAYQLSNSLFPSPTVQTRYSWVVDDYPLQQNRSREDESCPHCSELWFTHCECIFSMRSITQDCKENGQHQLHTSFQELKKHIQEHWVASGASCCLCQNHFSDHLLDLQLLSKVNAEDPRQWQIGLELREGVFAFRKHIREKHELRRGQGGCEGDIASLDYLKSGSGRTTLKQDLDQIANFTKPVGCRQIGLKTS